MWIYTSVIILLPFSHQVTSSLASDVPYIARTPVGSGPLCSQCVWEVKISQRWLHLVTWNSTDPPWEDRVDDDIDATEGNVGDDIYRLCCSQNN